MVQPKSGVIVPVRSRELHIRQNRKRGLCVYYPNCFDGNMCRFAHGEEELDYWEGTVIGIVANTGNDRAMCNYNMHSCEWYLPPYAWFTVLIVLFTAP